ncbi:class III chitinase [Dichotomocladium elegans]|nr:class III chitinase [Dichotomocladium elegans]
MLHQWLLALALLGSAVAFEDTCNNNVVTYWGQNSYGAAHPADKNMWQQPLRHYCDDNAIDMFPISFLTTFFSKGGKPEINLANFCNSVDNGVFPGTALANCTSVVQDDIKYCQARGKAITISLGGATGGVGFKTEDQALSFADTVWNDFLGGSSNTRPFGNAVLDGIDLDIEGGGAAHYPAFLRKLRSYFDKANKKFYITAAPQCIYPDENLQATLNAFPLDAVFVQFYNNPCGLPSYGRANRWNFGQWDYWARNISPNKNVKVYIGAPASSSAAGSGYVPLATLKKIALETRQAFPSFGGVMFWDTSQAVANGRMDLGIKTAMGNCQHKSSFLFQPCSAPSWDPSGRLYTAGNQVSHNVYIWEALWSASSEPTSSPTSDWMPVSACTNNVTEMVSSPTASVGMDVDESSSAYHIALPMGSGVWPPVASATGAMEATVTRTVISTMNETVMRTVSAETTVYRTKTVFEATTTITPGDVVRPSTSCSQYQNWSATTTYVGGTRVHYQGKIWYARWWTYGEEPNSGAQVWSLEEPCSDGQ